MSRLLYVCLGGAAGSGLRYLVGLWAQGRLGAAWPYGTLLVNGVGCLLMGLLMHVALARPGFPPDLRWALGTGFLGGLTTYSSYAAESGTMIGDGLPGRALVYIAATTGLGLAALAIGQGLGRWLLRLV